MKLIKIVILKICFTCAIFANSNGSSQFINHDSFLISMDGSKLIFAIRRLPALLSHTLSLVKEHRLLIFFYLLLERLSFPKMD